MTAEQDAGRRAVLDWLKVEFGIDKPSLKLQDVAALDAATLAAEVKKARGKKKPLSVAQVKALKDEHARSVGPAANAGRGGAGGRAAHRRPGQRRLRADAGAKSR